MLLGALCLKGIRLHGAFDAIVAALILGLANSVLRPFLMFMTFPITVLTLGIFTLVINGFILLLTSWFVPGFSIDGLFTAIKGSILISIFGFILKLFLFSRHVTGVYYY